MRWGGGGRGLGGGGGFGVGGCLGLVALFFLVGIQRSGGVGWYSGGHFDLRLGEDLWFKLLLRRGRELPSQGALGTSCGYGGAVLCSKRTSQFGLGYEPGLFKGP